MKIDEFVKLKNSDILPLLKTKEETSLLKIQERLTKENVEEAIALSIQLKYPQRKKLLEIGMEMKMNMDKQITTGKYMLYEYAVYFNDLLMLALLIKLGVNIYEKGRNIPIIHMAILSPNISMPMIGFLIDNGANVNNCTISPLLFAFACDKFDICKYLMNKGTNPLVPSMTAGTGNIMLKAMIDFFLSGKIKSVLPKGIGVIKRNVSKTERYEHYLEIMRCFFKVIKKVNYNDITLMVNIAGLDKGVEIMRTMVDPHPEVISELVKNNNIDVDLSFLEYMIVYGNDKILDYIMEMPNFNWKHMGVCLRTLLSNVIENRNALKKYIENAPENFVTEIIKMDLFGFLCEYEKEDYAVDMFKFMLSTYENATGEKPIFLSDYHCVIKRTKIKLFQAVIELGADINFMTKRNENNGKADINYEKSDEVPGKYMETALYYCIFYRKSDMLLFLLDSYNVRIDFMEFDVMYQGNQEKVKIPCALTHAIDCNDKDTLKCLLVDKKSLFVDCLSEASKYYLFCECICTRNVNMDVLKVICPKEVSYDSITKFVNTNKLKHWRYMHLKLLANTPETKRELITNIKCSNIISNIISGLYLIKKDMFVKFYVKIKNVYRLLDDIYKLDAVSHKMIRDVIETVCFISGVESFVIRKFVGLLVSDSNNTIGSNDTEKIKKCIDSINTKNIDFIIDKLAEISRLSNEILEDHNEEILSEPFHFMRFYDSEVDDLDKYLNVVLQIIKVKEIDENDENIVISGPKALIFDDEIIMHDDGTFTKVQGSLESRVKRLLFPLKWPKPKSYYGNIFELLMDKDSYRMIYNKETYDFYFEDNKIITIYKSKKEGFRHVNGKNKIMFRQYASNIGSKDDVLHMFPFPLDYYLKDLHCDFFMEKTNKHYNYYGNYCIGDKVVEGYFEYIVNDADMLFHRFFRRT